MTKHGSFGDAESGFWSQQSKRDPSSKLDSQMEDGLNPFKSISNWNHLKLISAVIFIHNDFIFNI